MLLVFGNVRRRLVKYLLFLLYLVTRVATIKVRPYVYSQSSIYLVRQI